MNDKRQEYLHLVNDKKLIGELLPNENDLNRFELWKKKICKRNLQIFILLSFLIIFVFTIIFISMIVTVKEYRLKIASELEYPSLNIGDEVIVFSVKGSSNAYITKKRSSNAIALRERS